MHRTQILLDEEQYLVLRSEARNTGKSLGQLIRDLVSAGLKRRGVSNSGAPSEISSLQGMIDDPGFEARDHDRVLYGSK